MCTVTTVTPSATDTAHNRQQLSQQLTNPQRPTLSSAAASLTCETTVSQGAPPSQLIPPTAVSDQTRPSPLTNQMMDIILQLQNQMQSEAARRANEEQEEEERSTAKQKKRNLCTRKESSADENTNTESAVHYDAEADIHGATEDATTSKPKRKKHENRPVIFEDAEDDAQPSTSTAMLPTTEASTKASKAK